MTERTTFDPEAFNAKIALLTDPDQGIVSPTPVDDLFVVGETSRYINASEPGNLLAVTGPSGAGKDTLMAEMMDIDPTLQRAQTATTRLQRPGESPDAYTWMRSRVPGEEDDEYIANLVREYDLVEYDPHHGQLYGLPMANLERAMSEGVGIINTDIAGVTTLAAKIGRDSLVSVLVCPESDTALRKNMGEDRDNVLGRMAVADSYLQAAPNVVDYVYLNRRVDNYQRAIRQAAGDILDLLIRQPEVSLQTT